METGKLLQTLKSISPAISSRDMIPMLSCFCFSNKKVTAYNGRVALTAPCDLQVEGAVKGSILLGFLNNAKSKELSLDNSNPSEVVIKSGRSKLTAPVIPKDSFIFESPATPPKATLKKTAESFVKSVESVLISAGNDPSHPQFLGVTFGFEKDRATFITCNNFSATSFQSGIKRPQGFDSQSVGMVTEFCELLVSIAKRDTPTTVEIGEGWIVCKFVSGTELFSTLLENDGYADRKELFSKVFQDSSGDWVSIPQTFSSALNRAMVPLADVRVKSTTFTVAKGKMKLFTKTDHGMVLDFVDFPGHTSISLDADPDILGKGLEQSTKTKLTDSAFLFKNDSGKFRFAVACQQDS